jgi:hypothetical protein
MNHGTFIGEKKTQDWIYPTEIKLSMQKVKNKNQIYQQIET